jgi:hypothetical protein
VHDGLRIILLLAKEGILEASEPRLLNLEVLVLNLLQRDLEGKTPAIDICLGMAGSW